MASFGCCSQYIQHKNFLRTFSVSQRHFLQFEFPQVGAVGRLCSLDRWIGVDWTGFVVASSAGRLGIVNKEHSLWFIGTVLRMTNTTGWGSATSVISQCGHLLSSSSISDSGHNHILLVGLVLLAMEAESGYRVTRSRS